MVFEHSLGLSISLLLAASLQKVPADNKMHFRLERTDQCPLDEVTLEYFSDSVIKCSMKCSLRDRCLGYCYSSAEQVCRIFDKYISDEPTNAVAANGYNMYVIEGSVGFLRFKSKLYEFSSNEMTFKDAAADCASRGSVMAMPESDEENDFLRIEHGLDHEFYIYGTNRLALDIWTNEATGEVLTYYNWASTEPNGVSPGECLVVLRVSTWNDHLCTELRKYVCAKEIFSN